MTLKSIEKRVTQLESKQPAGGVRVNSFEFEKYEDFLIEAKKARILREQKRAEGKFIPPQCEIVAIDIIPLADELRTCLQRMEAAGMDEELIEDVRRKLQGREEEEYLRSIL